MVSEKPKPRVRLVGPLHLDCPDNCIWDRKFGMPVRVGPVPMRERVQRLFRGFRYDFEGIVRVASEP